LHVGQHENVRNDRPALAERERRGDRVFGGKIDAAGERQGNRDALERR
jgi:hypothetical protein